MVVGEGNIVDKVLKRYFPVVHLWCCRVGIITQKNGKIQLNRQKSNLRPLSLYFNALITELRGQSLSVGRFVACSRVTCTRRAREHTTSCCL